MKPAKNIYAATLSDGQTSCEILILPDGRLLAHNISRKMAALLADLDPANSSMRTRADLFQKRENESAAGN